METTTTAFWVAAFAVFLINFPFGVLRAGAPVFSLRWFLYIHVPVFVVIPIRIGMGLSYWTIPALVLFSFLGQMVGSHLGRRWRG